MVSLKPGHWNFWSHSNQKGRQNGAEHPLWWIFRPHVPALQSLWNGSSEAPQTLSVGESCHVPSTMPGAPQALSQLILNAPHEADLITFSINCLVQDKTASRWWSFKGDSNTDTSKPVLFPSYGVVSLRRPCLQGACHLWKQDIMPPNKSAAKLFSHHLV